MKKNKGQADVIIFVNILAILVTAFIAYKMGQESIEKQAIKRKLATATIRNESVFDFKWKGEIK